MSHGQEHQAIHMLCDEDGKADVPLDPWVHIELQRWGTRDEGGAPVISPDW